DPGDHQGVVKQLGDQGVSHVHIFHQDGQKDADPKEREGLASVKEPADQGPTPVFFAKQHPPSALFYFDLRGRMDRVT
ncbi:hypothetical protein L9G16_24200, partial [Shewanella sp. A25]|nr:hypothetical protein [Shewanella shenzhenensis]